MGGCFSSLIHPFVFRPRHHREDEWVEALNASTIYVSRKLHTTASGTEYVCCEPIAHSNAKKQYAPLKTIVFCHGNTSDIRNMVTWFDELTRRCNVRVIGVEYPGYGPPKFVESKYMFQSRPYILKPSEQGCVFALRDVMSDVTSQYESDGIYLMGHSLGTGVVASYASSAGISNPIILISPYKSIARVVADSVLGTAVGLDMFCTWKVAPTLRCPVKIFHSLHDELIAPHHASDIHERLRDRSLPITWFEGPLHADTLGYVSFEEIDDVIRPAISRATMVR